MGHYLGFFCFNWRHQFTFCQRCKSEQEESSKMHLTVIILKLSGSSLAVHCLLTCDKSTNTCYHLNKGKILSSNQVASPGTVSLYSQLATGRVRWRWQAREPVTVVVLVVVALLIRKSNKLSPVVTTKSDNKISFLSFTLEGLWLAPWHAQQVPYSLQLPQHQQNQRQQ